MKTYLSAGVSLLWIAMTSALHAQSVRSLVNGGNDLYKEEKYAEAEVRYRKALEKEHTLVPGKFNLGNSLYKQGKFDEAVKEYESTLQPAVPSDRRAQSHYNTGNAYLRQQKYQEAIRSYIESLKLKPDDYDAKYNLSYALRMLKQQQNKNQKKQDKQDKQDQNNQQQQQQQKQDQNNQQQRPQQQEKRMSKADAERILDVLKNSERDVQKKLRTRQAVRPRTEKDW